MVGVKVRVRSERVLMAALLASKPLFFRRAVDGEDLRLPERLGRALSGANWANWTQKAH